jgi:hypothetical protein
MDFNALTTDGACGRNLLVAYWKARSQAEIPGLVLNVVALIVSAYLTWRIIKVCFLAGYLVVCKNVA